MRVAVQRELENLTEAGLLVRSVEGNQVHFRANEDSPVFNEIKLLMVKTAGVAEVIAHSLARLSSRVNIAFLYGSIAGGNFTADSDIGDPYELGTIAVDPGPPMDPVSWEEGPEEGLKRFHIDVSTDGLNCQTILSGTFGVNDLRQLNAFDVSAQKKLAKYVRIVTDEAQDPPRRLRAGVLGLPVIAERSMYHDNRREGSCSIGAACPAADYYLAEGTTGYGFTTYVLVQNQNDTQVYVTVTYMTLGGAAAQDSFHMQANTSRAIRVNDVEWMGDTDFSTRVHASLPAVAERAMYWNARRTYNMAGVEGDYPGIDGRASVLMRSLDGARPVVVERAMYSHDRGLGTETVGGYSE